MGLIKATLVSLAAATAVIGCANVDIEQAKKLSGAGVTASTRLQTEATETAAHATSWREGRVFERVLTTGRSSSADSDTFKETDKSEENLAKLLKARASALSQLVITYKSFQALTDYDAAQETEKAAAGFLSSTNNFVAKANEITKSSISPVDPAVAEGMTIGFGIIAAEVQKAQIKKASIAIRTGVETLAKALGAEELYASGARRLLAQERKELRAKARREGLGSYDQPLRALLVSFDVDPVKDLDAAVARSPKARAAIDRILADRDAAEEATIGESYHALIKTLDTLVAQHKALEAGQRVDLQSIADAAEKIEGYYQRIKGAGKKPADGK